MIPTIQQVLSLSSFNLIPMAATEKHLLCHLGVLASLIKAFTDSYVALEEEAEEKEKGRAKKSLKFPNTILSKNLV